MKMKCKICGNFYEIPSLYADEGVCNECSKKYPDALIKAMSDVWYGYIGLKNGQVLQWSAFETGEAPSIKGDWIFFKVAKFLNAYSWCEDVNDSTEDRGIWIRLDEIVWIADGNS